MTRPSRLEKLKFLHTIEDVEDDEEFVCPPPLAQRLGLLRGTLPTKCSTAPVQSVGRGLLSLSRKAPLPSGDNEIQATRRGTQGHRSSRIPKIPVIPGSDESDECSRDNDLEMVMKVTQIIMTKVGMKFVILSAPMTLMRTKVAVKVWTVVVDTVLVGVLWERMIRFGQGIHFHMVGVPLWTWCGLSAFGRRYCNESFLSNLGLFFAEELLNLIVQCTNDKAHIEKADFVKVRQSRWTVYIHWRQHFDRRIQRERRTNSSFVVSKWRQKGHQPVRADD